MLNLSDLNKSEAHRIVHNWINKNANYRRIDFKKEVRLRELLMDFVEFKWNENKLLEILKVHHPEFYSEMVAS